jgi:hypothetical protein
MPVILVNRPVDKKRIIGKMDGRGGGEVHGVVYPKNRQAAKWVLTTMY